MLVANQLILPEPQSLCGYGSVRALTMLPNVVLSPTFVACNLTAGWHLKAMVINHTSKARITECVAGVIQIGGSLYSPKADSRNSS